jgi:hypothetical protein
MEKSGSDNMTEKTTDEVKRFILEQYEKAITEKEDFCSDLILYGVEIGSKRAILNIGLFIGIDKKEFTSIEEMYAGE